MSDRSLGPLVLVASILGAIFLLPMLRGRDRDGGGEEPVVDGALQDDWTPTVS